MKIQVLELPTQHDGDRMRTPFLLIFSEVKPLDSDGRGQFTDLRDDSGAAHVFVTNDVVQL
jgi:hypothetical protein